MTLQKTAPILKKNPRILIPDEILEKSLNFMKSGWVTKNL